VDGKYLGKNDEGIDVFTIDLSQPAYERFRETSRYFKTELDQLADLYRVEVGKAVAYMIKFLDMMQFSR
jgi:hypothetical protein